MPIYELYWDGGNETVLVEIRADVITVMELLDEYRELDPERYNVEDFLLFLEKDKGIKCRYLSPDYRLYF